MKQLDLFYRAFEEYKKHTVSNMECVRFRRASQSFDKVDQQCLKTIVATCTIDEDWVEAIENGIPYLLKAIKEERQFIRTDGEVIPIEKIKSTSKQSIQDLAKHSNYISHEPTDYMNADVVPDKLLMIRKENDYTVYENRVLYATLLYLTEFVSSRLNKIKEITNKYESNLLIKKKIVVGNRTLDFDLHMNEIIKDDPIATKRNKQKDIIDRIEIIYSNIVSLIRMPLMVECSRVDIVSRPITKTNVLKMDNNFKHSLQLFEYISDYDKPGYTLDINEKVFHPMDLKIVDDYTEMIMLSSFLTYLHSNELENLLRDNYLEALKKEEEDRRNKILEKLKKIKIKANLEGKTLEEYLLIYDEAVKILNEKIDKLKQDIIDLEKKHQDEILSLNNKHQEEIATLIKNHELEITELNAKHEAEINQLNDSHQKEIDDLKNSYETRIEEMKNQYQGEIDELNTNIDDLNADLEASKKKFDEDVLAMKEEYEKKDAYLVYSTARKIKDMTEIKEKVESENIALRIELGKPPTVEEYSSRRRFLELKREKRYLDSFYEAAWRQTKKAIRKETFSVKPPKKEKKPKKVRKKADNNEEKH